MNRLVYLAVAGMLLALGAAAQDPEALAKKKAELDASMVQMKMVGAVKGMTVKPTAHASTVR